MRNSVRLALGLSLAMVSSAAAGTFDRSRLAPDYGVDALTRSVAQQQLGRNLFANPYASVTFQSVDVYDVFPYVESRTFQVVSDPQWNRLVFGELGSALGAYDGAGSPLGPLSHPHGMALDDQNHIYVADTGNDRIVVFAIGTELDHMALTPLFEIRGLSGPYDVAWADGGTPFVPADDQLFITDSGRNRIVSYALEGGGARQTAALGTLGSGRDCFAGPLAIAARSTAPGVSEVYVADSHTRRIVHLRSEGGSLRWMEEAPSGVDVVTSLKADTWGNLYAAAPVQGVVRKFGPALTPVAELSDAVSRPHSFEIPIVTLRDHRDGTVRRAGRASGVTLDQWSDERGMRLWNLGVEVSGLVVSQDGTPNARFMLTDRARIALDLIHAATGERVQHVDAGVMDAGTHSIALDAERLGAAGGGDMILRVSAASSYTDGGVATAATPFHMQGGAVVTTPDHALLMGNLPNPARAATTIAFLLPANPGSGVSLQLFDAEGRRVRTFSRSFATGLNQVAWDGTDDSGLPVRAGVYFYRLHAMNQDFTRKLVMVR